MDKEKQIFDKYGNYDFPTDIKQEGLNNATSQIEEMTKDLKENLRLCAGVKLLDHNVETIAYELSKKYQPKLPEDSVVLTEEEAERFRGQTINIAKIKAQASKETAEKIFKAFENGLSLYYPHGQIPYGVFQKVFDNLAKQFGVKIKE